MVACSHRPQLNCHSSGAENFADCCISRFLSHTKPSTTRQVSLQASQPAGTLCIVPHKRLLASMAGAGGGGAPPPPDPALFFQPVADRDAVVILVLPHGPEEAANRPQTRSAKRQRSDEEEAAAARSIRHSASAYQLKSASPKFW